MPRVFNYYKVTGRNCNPLKTQLFSPLATVTDVENPLMHFSFYLSLLALILIMLIVHYAFAL